MPGGDFISSLLYGPMWTFLCVLGRTGPLLAMMPPIQGSAIPNRVKVLLTLMIGLSVTPMVMANSTPLPPHLAGIVIGLAKELLLGLLFGTAVLMIITSLQIGGQVISSLASMDVAQAADPTTQETVSVVSQMLSSNRQLYLGLHIVLPYPIGRWIQIELSGGPASRSRTRVPGSSLRRPARVAPQDPAPTTTKS